MGISRKRTGLRTAAVLVFLAILFLPPGAWPGGRVAAAGQNTQEENASSEAEQPDLLWQQVAMPSEVVSALAKVTVPKIGALAAALHAGIETAASLPASPVNALATLGDLDGDGVSEVVLKWRVPELQPLEASALPKSKPIWELFLLAWDGSGWHASQLMTGAEKFTVAVIRLGKPVKQGIAVVTMEGPSGIPSPEVFQVKNHAAQLVWDSGADESRYEGYQRGQIEFRNQGKSEAAEMIVAGRADPGGTNILQTGLG